MATITETPVHRYTELAPADVQNATRKLPSSIADAFTPDVPPTVRHPPPADLEKFLTNPGMPRATQAVSKEKPHGTPNSPPNATVLQQHVMYFDFDGDGVIYPWDTLVGFRRLGFNWIISLLAPVFIHGSFSYPTQSGWLPDPLFSINIRNMHRTKHGSDSEVYDTEGRFVPQKFEEIFSKFDREGKGALSWNDIQEMVYTNANIMDPTGWIAERLEWYVFWLVAKDDKGLISKEKVRGQFDGSLWPIIAAEVEARRSGKVVHKKRE